MHLSLNSLKMYAKGFKKEALKDTKNMLNKANNHIWVKAKNGITTKILPSGTKVIQSDHYKQVITNNNKLFHKEFAKNGVYKIYSGNYNNGNITNLVTVKQRTAQDVAAEKMKKAVEMLKEKRESFIKKFNEKFSREIINNENGRVKITRDKQTGKIVSWFSKPKNSDKVSRGYNIYYPAGLGRESYVLTKDKFMSEQVVRNPLTGAENVKRGELPFNILKLINSK